VGFHVCEGRLFIPLVGATFSVLPAHTIAFFACSGASSEHYAASYFAVHLIIQAAGFSWQFMTLRDHGWGFTLSVREFFPSLRHCARVFLPVSLFYWVLFGGFGEFTGYFIPEEHIQREDYWASLFLYLPIELSKTPLVEYLAVPAFLCWKGKNFSKRSRLLILGACAILAAFMLVSSGIGALDPVTGRIGWQRWLHIGKHRAEGIVLRTAWMAFMPLCVLRWWVWGRYWAPVIVGLCGYLLTLAAFPLGGDPFAPVTMSLQLLAVIVVVVVLFIRSPKDCHPSAVSSNLGPGREPGGKDAMDRMDLMD
jgi:hypothetical protein